MPRRADGTGCENPAVPSRPVRRHVIIHGRVQGVFFRDALRERARTAGVAGRARNLPDGTVEAIFEGPLEAVERLVRFCELGPPRAHVDRIQVRMEAPAGLQEFEVR
jgi:acylphosphatase